ncbi:hypothetical protein, partial [Streptomyces sp. NPDC057909]|uniref:hypothetical protein n=1 Tax=Streptomyces sp. NPDC057909 TaxID=3346277 RepID=UPI0036E87DEA
IPVGGQPTPDNQDTNTSDKSGVNEPAPKWDNSCPDTNPDCHNTNRTPTATDTTAAAPMQAQVAFGIDCDWECMKAIAAQAEAEKKAAQQKQLTGWRAYLRDALLELDFAAGFSSSLQDPSSVPPSQAPTISDPGRTITSPTPLVMETPAVAEASVVAPEIPAAAEPSPVTQRSPGAQGLNAAPGAGPETVTAPEYNGPRTVLGPRGTVAQETFAQLDALTAQHKEGAMKMLALQRAGRWTEAAQARAQVDALGRTIGVLEHSVAINRFMR